MSQQGKKFVSFWDFVINNSKSFTLVASTITSVIAVLIVCGILCYDAYMNGYVKTDLQDAGIFVLCCSSIIAGGSVGKVFGKSKVATFANGGGEHHYDDTPEDSYEEPRRQPRRSNPPRRKVTRSVVEGTIEDESRFSGFSPSNEDEREEYEGN